MVCPNWRDPRNVGSAFRLADAAGLAGLVLAGSTPKPPNSRINKTARSTVRSVPYLEVVDPETFLREERSAGTLVIALEITDKSHSLLEYTLPQAVRKGQQKLLLVAGAEAEGVPQNLLLHCDASVHLPMYGQNTSMNVAVAVGAAIYLLLAQLAGGE